MAQKHQNAFISYSHRYRDWARAYHRDLQHCLDSKDFPMQIFFDETGLRPGDPWSTALEEALAKADFFLPVLTPEALTSPWIAVEHETFRANHSNWHEGFTVAALLVDTPLRAFQKILQYESFVDHDDGSYRNSLQQILARLVGSNSTTVLPELPPDLDPPPSYPAPQLAPELRQQLLDAMAPSFGDFFRFSFYVGKLPKMQLTQDLGSGDCNASAVITLFRDTHPDTSEQESALALIEQLSLPWEVTTIRNWFNG